MRTVLIMTFLVLIGFALLVVGNAAEQAALRREAQIARSASQAFAVTLKTQLLAAMKAEGPTGAIAVCQHIAPAISAQYSTQGFQVGRTALKLRNPANTPDEWERNVLKTFEQQIAKGADMATLERFEFIAKKGGGKTFRYMKAIPVGQACLSCHGSDIAPAIREVLAARYPEDQATGFALGALRGAFTIRKEMPKT